MAALQNGPEVKWHSMLAPSIELHVCGGLVRLSQTVDPICRTEHDREEDKIDHHENFDAWWGLATSIRVNDQN